MDTNEIPIISENSFFQFTFFVLAGLIFIGIQPILDKINSQSFLIFMLFLFLIMGLCLVYCSSTSLRQSDPKNCLEIAQHLNTGDYSDFKKENYLGWYPYQIYWITYLRPLVVVTNNIKFLYVLNLAYECIIFVTFYKITALFTSKNAILNNVSLLSMLFLPNLFNILFIYGNIPGYMFFLLSVYFLIKVLQGEKRIFLMAVTLIMAYFIKNNYLIGIIALFITVLLSNLIIKKILIFFEVIGLIFIISNCITLFYSKVQQRYFSVNGGVTKVAFVVMGLQNYMDLKNSWYDGYTLSTYKQHNYSEKETEKQAQKDLKREIDRLKSSRSNMVGFFKRKLISTWSDSTFQSLWIAPWENKANKKLKYIYNDNKESTIRIISNLTTQLILFCGGISCLRKNKK